jgi:hypothetical protein
MLPRGALTPRALAARARQALFTLYGFNFPVMVALLQMAVIAPVCYAVARPKLEWGLARGALPLALVNVLNVVCGLVGARAGGRLCPRAANRDSPVLQWRAAGCLSIGAEGAAVPRAEPSRSPGQAYGWAGLRNL